MDDNTVTMAGNLTADPKLNLTANGTSVANFRLASTPRIHDKTTGQWRDGESLFMSVSCWRSLAENVAASLKRGDRVVVRGKLKQKEYETSGGERKTSIEIEADMVGPDLARATVQVKKVARDAATPGAAPAPDPYDVHPEEAGPPPTYEQPPAQPPLEQPVPQPGATAAA